ncbi:unnamed protein product [Prunus brigantina]
MELKIDVDLGIHNPLRNPRSICFDGGERRFGDKDVYRSGPLAPGGDFGDKGGAPNTTTSLTSIPINLCLKLLFRLTNILQNHRLAFLLQEVRNKPQILASQILS